MNCWEFKKCGREESGKNSKELGVCPAYPDHGKHCAFIVGTLCKGEIQGSFVSKLGCLQCDFLKSEYYDHTYKITLQWPS